MIHERWIGNSKTEDTRVAANHVRSRSDLFAQRTAIEKGGKKVRIFDAVAFALLRTEGERGAMIETEVEVRVRSLERKVEQIVDRVNLRRLDLRIERASEGGVERRWSPIDHVRGRERDRNLRETAKGQERRSGKPTAHDQTTQRL